MTNIRKAILEKIESIDLEGALDLFAEDVVDEHMRPDIIRWRTEDPLATPHGRDPRIRIQSQRLKEAVLGGSEAIDVKEGLSIKRVVSVPYAFVNEGKYPYIERAINDDELVDEIRDFLQNSI